ncbi:MAG: VWA domain-containing protein [Lachnospiraceae bacterium]|nr:VWA domain-containing protein [Lachnospiraceae bacterium]
MGKISLKMLIVSILGGLIYGFLGEILYGILHLFLPRPVVTLIYFAGLFLFVALALGLAKAMMYSGSKGKVHVGKVIILFLILLASSALLEFIYDVVRKPERIEAESYIFVIDRSGSMNNNDPNGYSYQALENLLDSKSDKFQYAVYLFADEPELIRNMQPNSVPLDLPLIVNDGGTGIQTTLDQILKDIDNGTLKTGKNTKVIFMTDGWPTDFDGTSASDRRNFMNTTLAEYAAREIPISAVGLMDADDSLMEMIAEKTNGSYTDVRDAAMLDDAFKKAGSTDVSLRNLLNFREPTDMNVVLAILRILFFVILCMIIAVAKTELCENFRNTTPVLISSAIGGTLAGIAVELGMNAFAISPITMRVIACVLIAFTLLGEDQRKLYDDTENAKIY